MELIAGGGSGKRPDRPPLSLANVHGSVRTPTANAGGLAQYRAFAGPALLVSVGYMDPGNWGTDLQGGAQYRFALMWAVTLASLMAIVLQVTAARFGVVAGKDLAQACHDEYPRWTRVPQWLLAEVAIGACDLAEVLGSAVALNLLFHIPLLLAVLITGADVLLLLGLQRLGIRWIEAIILLLVVTIAVCFGLELFVLPHTRPDFGAVGASLLKPGLGQAGMATVGVVRPKCTARVSQLARPILRAASVAFRGRTKGGARTERRSYRLCRLRLAELQVQVPLP